MTEIQPLSVVTTVDALTRRLRDMILDGTIKPGERLREVEYASRFGVARHSFRAATQALVHEGLLYRTPNHGVHVPVLGVADVRDVYRVRAALELEALRVVITEQRPIQPAVEAVDRLEALPDRTPWRQLVDLDTRFHRAFVVAAGSPRLLRAYQTVQSEITLCLVQLRSHYSRPAEEVAAEHRAILAPVLEGDLAEAERELRGHFVDAAAQLEELLRAAEEPAGE